VASSIPALLVAAVLFGGVLPLDAQSRPPGARAPQGRAAGRGQLPPRLSPGEIQAQFDAYALVQAQDALQLSDEQYPQFVRRARDLQALRRQSRVQRNRLLSQLNQLLRPRAAADEARLSAATRALDEHDRTTFTGLQQAYAAVDEVLTPWQRARFRVLEDQLQQKQFDMLVRARQGPRR
jgi:hypothetical protein